jgi:hypothetical protein
MEAVLNYNQDAKNTWMQSQGFYEDVYGEMDKMESNA